MRWTVQLHDDFLPEFEAMTHPVQDELLAQALLLERFGPALGRPQVDTLKGSRYTHMKGLSYWSGRTKVESARKGSIKGS